MKFAASTTRRTGYGANGDIVDVGVGVAVMETVGVYVTVAVFEIVAPRLGLAETGGVDVGVGRNVAPATMTFWIALPLRTMLPMGTPK